MMPSDYGRIVNEEWEEMARRRQPRVDLDAWVVMPNHFHGILFIHPPRLHEPKLPLGEVIGHFKGGCTRRIEAAKFDWQPRFFDRVIRDEEMLLRFRRYIEENPRRWLKDKHHPDAPLNVETPRGASPDRG